MTEKTKLSISKTFTFVLKYILILLIPILIIFLINIAVGVFFRVDISNFVFKIVENDILSTIIGVLMISFLNGIFKKTSFENGRLFNFLRVVSATMLIILSIIIASVNLDYHFEDSSIATITVLVVTIISISSSIWMSVLYEYDNLIVIEENFKEGV